MRLRAAAAGWLREPREVVLSAPLRTALIVTVPVIAGIAVYYRYLGLWFWTDDFLWLEAGKNPDVLESFREAFTFPRGATPYWRPLVDLYFVGMYRVFGLNAEAYHVGNLVLHLTIAFTLGFLVHRLARSVFAGCVAAALFVVAPNYTAMVAWTSGVTATLSGVFALLALLAFTMSLQTERPARWLAVAVLGYVGAIMSKEDAVALLPVLLLLGLYLRPVRDRQSLVELARLWAPFVGVAAVFVALQLSLVVGSDEARGYEIGWHALPRLGEALRWISLPWPTWHASWVDAAQWASFLVLTIAAVVSALGRRWLPPVLYVATGLLLLPSSFFTASFAARWTYLATATWAAFLAVLLVELYRQVPARARAATGIVGVAVVVTAVVLLSQRTIDSHFWVPEVADGYEAIQLASTEACPTTTNKQWTFAPELPVADPGYAVPSLLRLYDQGRRYLVTERWLPVAPLPVPGDCVLWWEPDGYRARVVTPDWQGFDVWAPPAHPNLVPAIEGWDPAFGELAVTTMATLIASEAPLYGAASPNVTLARGTTYVAWVWVRGVDFQEGDRVAVALTEAVSGAALRAPVEARLTGDWQRVTLYYEVGAQPETASLGVALISDEGPSSFLARDAQLKVLGIPPP